MKREFDKELEQLRQSINLVDAGLLRLLNERAGLSLAVGRLKQRHGKPVFAPEREQLLLAALAAANPGPLSSKQLENIYRVILDISKELQSYS